MAKYHGLFTREEVRRMLGQFVRECRLELLKAGQFGKRGARVKRDALTECVKKKFEAEKQKKLASFRMS